jgi:DNA-binding transcriptional LysR family regulator
MNLNYLRYLETYVEAVKLSCLSKAAEKLYLSQPAVSIQISSIEKQIGVTLLERKKGNFFMTPEGKRFFRFADYVLHEHKRLLQDISQMRTEVTGKLIISASPILGEFMLPNILNEFKELNPSVEVQLAISKNSDDVIKGIKEGSISIGFCGIRSVDEELETISVAKDEQVLIVYPSHPFANQKEIEASDLIGEPLILRVGSNELKYLKTALIRIGFSFDQYPPKLILGTTTGVVSAVAAKQGISIVPSMAIRDAANMGLIKVVKIRNLTKKRDLVCVYKKDRSMDSVSKSFVDFMKSQFNKFGISNLSK